ncbi:MAG: BspA family leucine-rich repeat surface protein [Flavobacterium sp.]
MSRKRGRASESNMAGPPTRVQRITPLVVTDDNIHEYVKTYLTNKDASRLHQIGTWDVSRVTNMSNLFSQPYYLTKYDKLLEFNEDISGWNVSNVTNMDNMFESQSLFNQPLNNWNVSNVTTMKNMFSGAESFNQPLNNWNTSSLVEMKELFQSAILFNQPVDHWNVSNVTNMEGLFFGAQSFNQPLNDWNVSNVTTMKDMFLDAFRFNQPLNNWNVSNVTNMEGLFFGAHSFNQPLNNWNVSNVTNMEYMFSDAFSFNQDISMWNISEDCSTDEMFRYVQMTHRFMPLSVRSQYESYDEEEDYPVIDETVNREAQLQQQEQARSAATRAAATFKKQQDENPSPSQYEECMICYELLDNENGPGPTSKCNANCNDVVQLCNTPHYAHRGCVLSSCNADPVDTYAQMRVAPQFQNFRSQQRSDKCPFCVKQLLHTCNEYISVPKVPDDQLPIKPDDKNTEQSQTAGRKRRRTRRRARASKKRRGITRRRFKRGSKSKFYKQR